MASRLERAEVRTRVTKCLDRLGPDQREAFVLRGVEMLSNREAARVAGKRPNTMAKNYQRALESLRRHLPELGIYGFPRT